jgi:hypothetical protein
MAHTVWLLSLLTLISKVCCQGNSCYYPDGSSAASDTPCFSTSGASVCCGDGFACLANGICQVTSFAFISNPDLNKQINYYRGSCTDQTWSSSSCPQFCIGTQYAGMYRDTIWQPTAHEQTRQWRKFYAILLPQQFLLLWRRLRLHDRLQCDLVRPERQCSYHHWRSGCASQRPYSGVVFNIISSAYDFYHIGSNDYVLGPNISDTSQHCVEHI